MGSVHAIRKSAIDLRMNDDGVGSIAVFLQRTKISRDTLACGILII